MLYHVIKECLYSSHWTSPIVYQGKKYIQKGTNNNNLKHKWGEDRGAKESATLYPCTEHLNRNLQFMSMTIHVMSIVDVLLAHHLVGHVIHNGIEVHLPYTNEKVIHKGHKTTIRISWMGFEEPTSQIARGWFHHYIRIIRC